jgi:hypothetical protein
MLICFIFEQQPFPKIPSRKSGMLHFICQKPPTALIPKAIFCTRQLHGTPMIISA